MLDNGHVLVLSPGNGNITEFDMEGKEVGRFDLPGASHGFRLPNGHTLVMVQGNQVHRTGQELEADQRDRAGGTRPSASNDGKLVFSSAGARRTAACLSEDRQASLSYDSRARVAIAECIEPTSHVADTEPGGDYDEQSILSSVPGRGVAGGQLRRGWPGGRPGRSGPGPVVRGAAADR